MQRYPMTPQGHATLEAELKQLKSVDRPRITAAIAEAREHGDLKEDAEYHAAKTTAIKKQYCVTGAALNQLAVNHFHYFVFDQTAWGLDTGFIALKFTDQAACDGRVD